MSQRHKEDDQQKASCDEFHPVGSGVPVRPTRNHREVCKCRVTGLDEETVRNSRHATLLLLHSQR